MWLLRTLLSPINEFILASLEVFADLLNNVFDFMYTLNKSLDISKISTYLEGVALLLVAVMVLINAINTYLLRIEGDYEEEPIDLLVRITRCVVIILCGSWALDYMLALTSSFTEELLKVIGSEEIKFTNILTAMIVESSGLGDALSIIQAIIYPIFFVLYVIFLFKAAKRGAELMGFELLMPLVALDTLKANDERWRAFSTELFICITGYIIQLVFFNLFLKFFIQGTSTAGFFQNPYQLLGAFALLGFVVNGPKWMQKFMYKSGISDKVSGGGRGLLHLLPHLLRR